MPETQPWNQIPYADSPDRDDELLLVKAGENSRRILYKKLLFNQLAEVSWVVDGSISMGIGTANIWGNVPYNVKDGPDWIALNADGSFTLSPGIYLLDCKCHGSAVNRTRFRLFDGTSTLIYGAMDLSASSLTHSVISLKKKQILSESKTIAFQINVSSVNPNFYYYSVGALPGFNPTIAQCFVWRLG